MRHEAWLATFELRDRDAKTLAERILARPVRLELEWTDEENRKTRVYLPDDGRTQLWIDQIGMQEETPPASMR